MVNETPPSERSVASLEAASTADLVREAMEGARELVRLEVALAKEEMKAELEHVQRAAVGLGIALASSVLVLCLLSVALVFLVIGGVAALVGYSKLPKAPLERTRHRLETDMIQLKEHIA